MSEAAYQWSPSIRAYRVFLTQGTHHCCTLTMRDLVSRDHAIHAWCNSACEVN